MNWIDYFSRPYSPRAGWFHLSLFFRHTMFHMHRRHKYARLPPRPTDDPLYLAPLEIWVGVSPGAVSRSDGARLAEFDLRPLFSSTAGKRICANCQMKSFDPAHRDTREIGSQLKYQLTSGATRFMTTRTMGMYIKMKLRQSLVIVLLWWLPSLVCAHWICSGWHFNFLCDGDKNWIHYFWCKCCLCIVQQSQECSGKKRVKILHATKAAVR